MTSIEARLDRIRGPVPALHHNARTIAALTSNPGCARRAILDAAGADKQQIATYLGFPPRFGQSQFAITRGNSFEAQVKANGCAALLTLLHSAWRGVHDNLHLGGAAARTAPPGQQH
jgi:hypothetical protein